MLSLRRGDFGRGRFEGSRYCKKYRRKSMCSLLRVLGDNALPSEGKEEAWVWALGVGQGVGGEDGE